MVGSTTHRRPQQRWATVEVGTPARVRQQRPPSGLASIASRSFFLSGQLLLGNLRKTVVVVGNAPHNRPGFLVAHLIGNRASFLCTKAPMLRVPETNFLHRIASHQ